ncbi:MAG TPA: hypothetical protein VHA75_17770 [Rugosimonospora sp.]|nr:hypothetical protein [Rugosimonospora sp.]
MLRPNLAIATHRMTTGAAPVQIEGTLTDGREFYFRSRHRTITLGAGATQDEAVAENLLALELKGFSNDRHALSCLEETDAVAIAQFLVRLLGDCEEHAARPPYEQFWRETGDTDE